MKPSKEIQYKSPRVATTRALGASSVCNICGQTAVLTEDHVPPTNAYAPGKVLQMSVTDFIGSPQDARPRSGRIKQKGVAFKSLCNACNNNLLGGNYDREFCRFIDAFKDEWRTRPKGAHVVVSGQPNKIARAVVGHLLAADADDPLDRNTPVLQQLREYVTNPGLTLPPALKLYYWKHPYREQLTINGGAGIGYPEGVVVFMLLKFYPMTFLLTSNEPDASHLARITSRAHRLDTLLSAELDKVVSLAVGLNPGIPRRWPESSHTDGRLFTLLHDSSIAAVPLS